MKQPTPKADGLRAMRESRYKSATVPPIPLAKLREKIAAVPVKRAPKAKKARL